MNVRIDRCICEDKSFADLLASARSRGITSIEALAAVEGCATHCGMCGSYLRQTLRSGQTVFSALLPAGAPILVKNNT